MVNNFKQDDAVDIGKGFLSHQVIRQWNNMCAEIIHAEQTTLKNETGRYFAASG